MHWYTWAVLIVLALSSAVTIARVDQPDNGITPGVAMGTLVINILLAWAVIATAANCT